jgi:hypothetical protein
MVKRFTLNFYPEDGGNTFLRNLSNCLLYCMELNSSFKSVYLRLYSPLLGLGRFFSFLIFTQSVGLLGRGISPSQGRYLHTGQHEYRINAHKHPCLKWDSNPRAQCLNGRKKNSSCLRLRGHCDRLLFQDGQSSVPGRNRDFNFNCRY